ncbi:FMN-dependent NADH-azoreductase [Hafnia alvei]|uniref:FMN-dependent NADH-azoreductase n=1 Tax=Hafnia alvei TaxID=569 RepID=UPI0040442B87
MKLLHIDSSPFTTQSTSRVLSAAIVTQLQEKHRIQSVIYRDVGLTPPPHLTEAVFNAMRTGVAGCSDEVIYAVDAANQAIEELKMCDALVIGAPMFNHSIVTNLKSWIDQVCQAGKTFAFTSQGAQGLIADKPVFIASTRGGIYADDAHRAMDFQEPYLVSALSLMGLKNVKIIRAEGVDKTYPGRSEAQRMALEEIKNTVFID